MTKKKIRFNAFKAYTTVPDFMRKEKSTINGSMP